MRKLLPVALLGALALSSLGGVAVAKDAPAAAAPLVKVKSAAEIPPPPEGKGQVVFFRKSSLMGMPYWTNIRENGTAYGKLTNGVYFVKVLEPGTHEFNTSVLGKDSMRVEVDPGETYFVEGKITMALVGYTIVMAPSDSGKFNKSAKGMKPVAATAEAAADADAEAEPAPAK